MLAALMMFRRLTFVSLTAGLALVQGIGIPGAPRVSSPGRAGSPTVRVPVQTVPPVAPLPTAHFSTLPVGAALPSDADCAARVRKTAEIRPQNAPFNVRASGPAQGGFYARVTGNFAGTTDEISQWASCKWGIDEDIVRAQAAKESGWFQQGRGDWTADSTRCVPGHGLGIDGRAGQCPESIGMMQTRYPYLQAAFPMATNSTAYNLDEALAARRSCFEGNETWLNQFPRGQNYAAGDLWGCVGMWFAGRWHTTDADTYTATVQDYLNSRIWETADFRSWTPV